MKLKKNDQDTGFVLSITPYRESDAMVHFFGEKIGLVRFVLAGYYKPQSKQSRLGIEFSKVKLMFNYKENSLMRIQSGELLESYYDKREEYNWLVYMSLVSEILVKLYQNNQQSFWLSFIQSVYKRPTQNNLLLEVVKIIKESGITPVVDYCVVSGSQKISDFSIEHGGFVSKAYRKTNLNLEQLKQIRSLFKGDLTESMIEDKDAVILDLCIRYIEIHMDVKFNSWKLYYDV